MKPPDSRLRAAAWGGDARARALLPPGTAPPFHEGLALFGPPPRRDTAWRWVGKEGAVVAGLAALRLELPDAVLDEPARAAVEGCVRAAEDWLADPTNDRRDAAAKAVKGATDRLRAVHEPGDRWVADQLRTGGTPAGAPSPVLSPWNLVHAAVSVANTAALLTGNAPLLVAQAAAAVVRARAGLAARWPSAGLAGVVTPADGEELRPAERDRIVGEVVAAMRAALVAWGRAALP